MNYIIYGRDRIKHKGGGGEEQQERGSWCIAWPKHCGFSAEKEI